jgi:hypothetical protein
MAKFAHAWKGRRQGSASHAPCRTSGSGPQDGCGESETEPCARGRWTGEGDAVAAAGNFRPRREERIMAMRSAADGLCRCG